MRKVMKQMASGKMPNPEALLQRPDGRQAAGGRCCNLRRRLWQYESDSEGRVRTRTRCGASSSPTGARPRDGRSIETIGSYNPQTDPSQITIDTERAQHWLDHGAQPSRTVARLLRTEGVEVVGR